MNKLNKIKKRSLKPLEKEEKKLIIWEGFRKELPWIIFWILIGIMAYGYYQDKKICEEILANPCDACYKLNQTLMESNYLFEDSSPKETFGIIYPNIIINESLIPLEDKEPNSRTISNYSTQNGH